MADAAPAVSRAVWGLFSWVVPAVSRAAGGSSVGLREESARATEVADPQCTVSAPASGLFLFVMFVTSVAGGGTAVALSYVTKGKIAHRRIEQQQGV